MPNRANLELLKAAALRGDWQGAAEAYLEFAFDMIESGERKDLSALRWALRLRSAENVAVLVDEMLGEGGSNS